MQGERQTDRDKHGKFEQPFDGQLIVVHLGLLVLAQPTNNGHSSSPTGHTGAV